MGEVVQKVPNLYHAIYERPHILTQIFQEYTDLIWDAIFIEIWEGGIGHIWAWIPSHEN